VKVVIKIYKNSAQSPVFSSTISTTFLLHSSHLHQSTNQKHWVDAMRKLFMHIIITTLSSFIITI